MTARRASTPRTILVRGVLSWSVVLVAIGAVGLSLALPALLRGIGLGPVTSTATCMITLALLIGHYAPALGLYPSRPTGTSDRVDRIVVSAAVLGCASAWLIATILGRRLIADEDNGGGIVSAEPYLLIAVFVLVIAPVTEEILYRGLLQGALNRVFPVVVSLVLSTLVFALAHPRPRDMILAAAIGLTAGALREVFGTMMMPILAHVAMNTVSFVVPPAAVNSLAHHPAALPVLVLLGVATVTVALVMVIRSPAGSARLRRDSLT